MMLEKNDLLAIAELLNSSLEANNKVLTKRMDQMDSAIQGNQTEIRQTRVLIENQSHSIRLIAEQHGEIINRLPAVEEQASLKSRVQVLETVVVQLRTEMESLRKAN